MLLRLPNEPVGASAPNFLATAVSPGTLLCTFLCFCSPLSSGSVCVYLCVFMSAFFHAAYQISTFTQRPPPPHLLHLLLCLCKWSSHLGLMKAGSKSECRAATGPLLCSFTVTSRAERLAWSPLWLKRDSTTDRSEDFSHPTDMIGGKWRHTCTHS